LARAEICPRFFFTALSHYVVFAPRNYRLRNPDSRCRGNKTLRAILSKQQVKQRPRWPYLKILQSIQDPERAGSKDPVASNMPVGI
jgi:hypothetical protein